MVLAIIMTASLLMGAMTEASLEYISYDYELIKDADENLFFAERLVSALELASLEKDDENEFQTSDIIQEISKNPNIEYACGIRVANPATVHDYGISVTLYDEKILESFPALKDIGIDFGENQNGVVVVGDYFKNYSDEEIEIFFSNNEKRKYKITGHVETPYKTISFENSASEMYSNYLIDDYNTIIMAATPENIRDISKISMVEFEQNYVFKIKETASEKERMEAVELCEKYGKVIPFKNIIKQTEEEYIKKAKETIPRPIFLFLVSYVAYLSLMVLSIRKKEKEMAIYYLCGLSKRKCIGLTLAATLLVAGIPMLITLLFVSIIKIDGFYFTGNTYMLVMAFFAIATLLSILTITLSIRKKTPLTFLRRNE